MLLPEPQRRGEIQFVLAKALPYGTRVKLILALLAGGFVVQGVGLGCGSFLLILAGAALLLPATLLSLVRGYSNVPVQTKGAREWRGADRENLQRILTIAGKAKTWDRSVIDITNGLGCACFVVVLGVVIFVDMALLDADQLALGLLWIVDASVLLLVHWFTGVRKVLTNDPLTIKVNLLLAMLDVWKAGPQEGEELVPQMEVLCSGEGQVPQDVKLILKVKRLGDQFLGLQVQVTINNVQGSDYPYLYCVIVTRKGFGLHQKCQPVPPKGILAEAQIQQDVELVIIRQETTKTSGYHTDQAAATRVFSYALEETRKLPAPG